MCVGVSNDWLSTVWPNLRKCGKSEEIFNAEERLLFKTTSEEPIKFKDEKCVKMRQTVKRSVDYSCSVQYERAEKNKLLIVGKSK